MNTPCIEEVTDLAWSRISAAKVAFPGYHVSVWQRHSSTFEARVDQEYSLVKDTRSYWTIEYGGESFQQPYLTARGFTIKAVLEDFRAKLEGFVPLSMEEINRARRQASLEETFKNS